ncbi:hypothetical protein BV25DRAFT_1736217 [Artomyces pyxidatus]|uniref:Uncharacterized protein n=1 Tax=Artomyces pyxidatus TaxID=48021 RepID=A0ACB8SIV7_9AGAM|nr:hypothetical protein BV25DRAFT_1736217 [Artomyces pyxidatus]
MLAHRSSRKFFPGVRRFNRVCSRWLAAWSARHLCRRVLTRWRCPCGCYGSGAMALSWATPAAGCGSRRCVASRNRDTIGAYG